MKTLPQLCLGWCASVDVVRGLIRANPELRVLGAVFGATRVFNEREAAAIKAALDARQAARRKGATACPAC